MTFAEILAAAAALRPEQKRELLVFLALRLRAEGAPLPEPRTFSREQLEGWIAEDESDMSGLIGTNVTREGSKE